jgi:hypothetical protein
MGDLLARQETLLVEALEGRADCVHGDPPLSAHDAVRVLNVRLTHVPQKVEDRLFQVAEGWEPLR